MRGVATAKVMGLILATAISGCASPSPFDAPPGMNAPAGNMSAPTPAAVQSQGPTMTPPVITSGSETYLPSTEGVQSPSAWKQPSPAAGFFAAPGATILASMRQTRDSVSSALKIESPTTPAADPTRLDNHPANASMVSADLHYHAGRVFEANNSLQVAASHYRDALAQTPNDPRLVLSYARVQDRAGNFQEAETAYRRAIELAPNDAKALNDLAMCHNRQAKWDSALGNLQQAIRIDPANPLYRNNLALVLVDAGRSTDAFQQLAAVHGEAAAHYNLGYMLLERKQQDEAEQHFMRALELNPRLTQAQQMIEYLQFGAEAAQNKQDKKVAGASNPWVSFSSASPTHDSDFAKRLPGITR